MKNRRLAFTVGAAGGGIVAAAFLQPAAAFADAFDITPDPTSAQDLQAIGGQPQFDQLVTGLQLYDSTDLTTGGDTGSFDGVSLNDVNTFGEGNQEIFDAFPDNGTTPPQDSFFDTLNFGHGFENVYTDLAGTVTGGSNTITDTVVTPFGNFDLPTAFDATNALSAAEFAFPSTSSAFTGESYVPDFGSTVNVDAIGGTAPFDQSVSGSQFYDVDDSTGTPIGNFEGVSYNDVNALGQTNQEILVEPLRAMQRDVVAERYGGGGGFGGGNNANDPSTGSIFDTVNYGHGFENVYTDMAATDTSPQSITDTVVTPFGDVNVPTSFDAGAALPAATFTFPSGSSVDADYSYLPDSGNTLEVHSISGQPLLDQTVSGTQVYDVDAPGGIQEGQFDGVSSHAVNALGFSNQEIQVVDDITGRFGDTSTADPAPGSFFDTMSGFGYANVYSDVVGTDGASNTITDTLITPFGDFSLPAVFAATDALPAAEFFFPAGNTVADLASAVNPADFGALLGDVFSAF